MIAKADSRGKKEPGNKGTLKRMETLIRHSSLGQVRIILKLLLFPPTFKIKIVISIYVREVLTKSFMKYFRSLMKS